MHPHSPFIETFERFCANSEAAFRRFTEADYAIGSLCQHVRIRFHARLSFRALSFCRQGLSCTHVVAISRHRRPYCHFHYESLKVRLPYGILSFFYRAIFVREIPFLLPSFRRLSCLIYSKRDSLITGDLAS